MNPLASDLRLSDISTWWSQLRLAHSGPTNSARQAQALVLDRYSPAVIRYLLAAVRDADVAWDLYQEFALKFVRGDFRNATPERGRFRDFLRSSLFHLVVDHQRQQKRTVQLSEPQARKIALPADLPEQERLFLNVWRDELVRRSFAALQTWEIQSGQPLYTVLRLRTDQPDLSADEMAERLAPLLGKPVRPEWVRNRLHHARRRFIDLLLDEVVQSLSEPSPEELAQELSELELLDRCREALERWCRATER